jgi:hypothetical protein
VKLANPQIEENECADIRNIIEMLIQEKIRLFPYLQKMSNAAIVKKDGQEVVTVFSADTI